MSAFQDHIKLNFQKGNGVQKLIYINIACFVIPLIIGLFEFILGSNSNLIYDWFSLDSNWSIFLTRPWTIISYGFLHASFIHLLLNMIVLFYIGNLFLEYFTTKQLYNFYLLGTLFGGLMFLMFYNLSPNINYPRGSILVGASAGVTAIFIGIATYIPQYAIRLMFVGYVKLWILALVWVGLDLIQLSDSNTGGHLAHLGGALFGFMYMKAYQGKTISLSVKNWFNFEKSKLKTVHKNTDKSSNRKTSKNDQERVNIILEKIGKSGYDSLSKEEKEFLFKQGN